MLVEELIKKYEKDILQVAIDMGNAHTEKEYKILKKIYRQYKELLDYYKNY